MIFSKMKEISSDYLGFEVKEAVLSLPRNFNNE